MVNDGARVRTPGTQRRKKQGNEVRDPVEVMCRVRPLPAGQDDSCITVLNDATLRLSAPEQSRAYLNSKDVEYSFKRVFDESLTQSSLFRVVALPLVDDLLRGRNGLLFTYGITGSGKTHTMTGNPSDGGLLPRSLDVLFNALNEFQSKKYIFKPDKLNGFDIQSEVDAMLERQQRDIMPSAKACPPKIGLNKDSFEMNALGRLPDPTKIEGVDEDNGYAVFVSYCEIYNNYVYDLLEEPSLDPRGQPKPPQSRKLREDAAKRMYVDNCTEVEVKSTEEAYEALVKGDKYRHRAHTMLNHDSSRSHTVFNIRLVQAPLDAAGEEVLLDKSQVTVSQLSLVDLAGSERQDRTKAAGDRLKEAGQINNSLMTLRTCIETLRDNQQAGTNKMVPYRDSRMTQLFKNFFEGEGKVKMVVCVNPMAADYDETLHVMKFAEVTQEVKTVRSTGVKNNLGLTPGRRRAHACRKALEEEGGNSAGSDSGSLSDDVPPLVFDLGPPLPVFPYEDPYDETLFPTLIEVLQLRLQRRNSLKADLQRRYDAFRGQLQDVETEVTTLRGRVAELETALQSRDKEIVRLRKRLQQSEASASVLKKNHAEVVLAKKDLESELETKAQRIRQEKDARRRLQEELNSKMQLWETRTEHKHQQELRKQAEKHQAEKRVQDQRFHALKEIINSDDPNAALYASQVEPDGSGGGVENLAPAGISSQGVVSAPPMTKSQSANHVVSSASKNQASGSTPTSHVKNLASNFERGSATPSSSSDTISYSSSSTIPKRFMTDKTSSRNRNAGPYSTTKTSRAPHSQRSQSPPPSSNYKASEASVVSKPSSRRRSRSTGNNVWLDHRPAASIDVPVNDESIMQPKIPSGEKRVGRKSLTKIDVKDTEKATKYLLTSQRVDSDGEVETQVFKGDVLPTRCGGSEVKMTEVEIHKHKRISPGSKRSYSLSRELDAETVNEVESRCNIGIEGHAKARKN